MYSQQELDDAIASVVSLKAKSDSFGVRALGSTFDKLTDAAVGLFISEQDAPFYVVKLGCSKLQEVVAQASEQAQNIAVLAQACGSKSPPITSLNALASSVKALGDLSSSMDQRSSSFSRVEDVPAWQRFNNQTQAFLTSAGKAVRYGQDVVPTAEEARPQLGSAFTLLTNSYAECIRRVTCLRDAIDDFKALQLPATMSASVIANAKAQLTSRLSELEPMSPAQRNAVIRSVVLDLLAARAAVKGFGSLTGPTTFAIVSGLGKVFADATHPATPAELEVEVPGPFTIVPGHDELDLFVDVDPVAVTVTLQSSFIPQLESTTLEPYDITAAHGNNRLRLQIKGWPMVTSTTNYDVTFADNATKPIWDVCSEINAVIPIADPVVAEPYFIPLKYSGALTLTVPGTAHAVDLTNTNPSLDMTTLLTVGDRIMVVDPTSTHYGTIYSVMVISPTVLQCDLVNGVVGITEGLRSVEGGGNAMALRLRISNANDSWPKIDWRTTSISRRVSLMVASANAVSVASQAESCRALGLFPNAESKAQATTSVDLANSINSSFYNRRNGAPVIAARTEFAPIYYDGLGRTEPNNTLLIVAARYAASGTCTGGALVTYAVTGAQTAGVIVGDTLVIRASTVLADLGKMGLVQSKTDVSISVLMDIAITAANVDVEIGPTFTSIGFDPQVVVKDGPNIGTYVATLGTVPFEFTLDHPLPFYAGPGNYPIPLNVSVGRTLVYISSKNTTLVTAIEASINGNPATAYYYLFISPSPISEVGMTAWWQMPELPKSVRAGDQLELYNAQYNVPALTSVIEVVETSTKLLQLTTAPSVGLPSYPFDVTSSVPFARIRYNHVNNFGAFKTAAATWIDAPTKLGDLSLALNVLGVNTNPTPSQVGDAMMYTVSVENELIALNTLLGAYVATTVPPVDALIASYREKAADRAVDTLLEGRFKDFFALDQDDVSYSGAAQKAIKNVMSNDLPIRKTGSRLTKALILAQFDDTDYEFDNTTDNADVPHSP